MERSDDKTGEIIEFHDNYKDIQGNENNTNNIENKEERGEIKKNNEEKKKEGPKGVVLQLSQPTLVGIYQSPRNSLSLFFYFIIISLFYFITPSSTIAQRICIITINNKYKVCIK